MSTPTRIRHHTPDLRTPMPHVTTPRWARPQPAMLPQPWDTALAVRHTRTDEVSRTAPRLFVDLTSPWAYLAHLRLADLDVTVEWAAVQRETTIPRTGLRGNGPARDHLERQLEAVRAEVRGDEVPTRVPAVLPHPRTVAAAYAEAVDLGVGAEARAVLLEAYWQDGQDIGDPEVLRRLMPTVIVGEHTLCTGDPRREFGYLVSPAREPLTNEAYHQLARWQEQWDGLGRPGPLALVGASGTVRTGVAALRV
ncbi:hypothetical protein FNH13_09820 [Ornithinimicrobium ciconiae]|uniref:Uncharacterized protein n=1 Tax=Ornithinimicrobium ciconiae TaxID=2594265 RepID=A0A516GAR1_9MICO|nr:hypothetical protein [Ornithinimicrobium ciconiae]QDO88595.1 hypothetical protein FNH13_09820 [Ornithinimicrobium ciconiae]